MLASPHLLCVALVALGQPAQGLQVELSFSKDVQAEPFTGRVLVVASKAPLKDGSVSRLNWFAPQPFFAQDVKAWAPGTPLKFAPIVGFPQPWTKLPEGKYYLQAILDRDLGGMNYFSSPGNGYSKAVALEHGKADGPPVKLTIDQLIAGRKFAERERVKLFEIESKLLSDFHQKPIKLRAGVALPKSHAADKDKRYPVMYEIPGFGGDHFGALGAEGRTDVAGLEFIHVMLDPNCRLGHHVFADSANNGPYGKALTEELLPQLEAKFRGLGEPRGRLVTGHSSGGWSSLWLQVAYPKVFGGVWSTAPDPVDFRDFQRINIYDSACNMFRDEKGQDRPIARNKEKTLLKYKPFSDMEVVMGRGGQLWSFEAVFSPKASDGQPAQLWDRGTGQLDPQVAKAWEKYDIRLVLERNWKTLAPDLQGKLHLYMGGEDTFLLEGATRLLQKSLKSLGSDAVVEIIPGRNHGNLIDAELRQRMQKQMRAAVEISRKGE